MERNMPHAPPLDVFLKAPVALVIICEYIPLFDRSFDGDSVLIKMQSFRIIQRFGAWKC